MKNKVVCLSTINYHPLPTRKQNVMNRLQNAEVLYFDPPVSLIAPLKDSKCWDRLTAFLKPGEQPQDNVTVYALPPVLPFFYKFRWINRINQWMQARYVRKKMRAHGFHADSVLWCYSPSSADILEHVPHKSLVYDCVDRHAGYKGNWNPDIVNAMEKDLAQACDMVFSTAAGLHETLSAYNEHAEMIPNGAAYEIFSRVHTDKDALQCPEKMKNLSHPVFGFVGMLQECIDYDLMEALAKARPDATIFCIGRALPGVDLSRFEKYKNVVFNGLVPQKELPDYIAQFDVCLNVFQAGMLSRDVSPLKFYEYLATGKPIVSSKEPLQVEDFADVVYIANDTEEFLRHCETAVQENDPEKTAQRIRYGAQCSWTERVHQMEDTLYKRDILSPK